MKVATVRIACEGEIYSPFSGKRTTTKSGDPNKRDKTFLFSHYGNAGLFGHISKRVEEATGKSFEDLEDRDPVRLAKAAGIPGTVVFVVDAGWNGIDHYAFAPVE